MASERVQRAHLCAERLLEWMAEHKDVSIEFATNVISSLEECCRHHRHSTVTCRMLKERICMGEVATISCAPLTASDPCG